MKQFILNTIYYFGGCWLLRKGKIAKKTITILSLHRINDEKDIFWQAISVKHFKNLLKYISKHYQVCFFSEIEQFITAPERPLLVLSFDDGYFDFIEHALPLLQKYNLKSNHNLVVNCLEHNEPIWTQRFNQIFNHLYQQKSNEIIIWNDEKYQLLEAKNFYLGYQKIFYEALKTEKKDRNKQIDAILKQLHIKPKQDKMMDWKDAAYCINTRLVEIGSHTISHESLVSIKNSLDLWAEIADSKSILSDKLATEINILALPNGQNNPEITKLTQKSGYKWLLETGDKNYNHLPHQKMIVENDKESIKIASRINIENESEALMNLRVENLQGKIRHFFQKK